MPDRASNPERIVLPFGPCSPTWPGDPVLNRRLAVLILASCLTTVHAQDEADGPDAGGFLQAPEVVPSPVTGEAVEPDITIRESGGEIIYEYRVRGVLYMVRIQPQFGPPYYLYDLNGDGLIDAQERAARNISVPQWVLFEWN
ncbi:hypothetical protein Atep_17000 [Allochromatium tepidum]|uniref:DUF2782 domain-containing protein n=1 Tax=Allochromatium tepidum TaxID=553982 RepID=A0ABN6GCF3_9GAMM|nr:hypothetical protein Atep_17000 [Allochromatium tepidum]